MTTLNLWTENDESRFKNIYSWKTKDNQSDDYRRNGLTTSKRLRRKEYTGMIQSHIKNDLKYETVDKWYPNINKGYEGEIEKDRRKEM